jgi:hypothetical protein
MLVGSPDSAHLLEGARRFGQNSPNIASPLAGRMRLIDQP